jgi:hypothetical protein
MQVGRIKFGPLYADRDPSELEPWYSQHVNAMTAEGLHSKSDIAAELAYRDRQIRELSDALAWTAQRLRDVIARRPVRDATECLANADRLTGSNRLSCMNQEDSHADPN